MESSKNPEGENSIYKGRKITSVGYQKIRSLFKSFEEEKILDKRYAMAGILILLAALPSFLLYEKVTDYFISPDYVVVATLVDLFEVQKKQDENRERYIVKVEIEDGGTVKATVNKNDYFRLKVGGKVKLGYFKDAVYYKYGIAGYEN